MLFGFKQRFLSLHHIGKFSDFPTSKAKNSGCSSTCGFIIKHIRDLLVIHILAKFGADSSMFADARR